MEKGPLENRKQEASTVMALSVSRKQEVLLVLIYVCSTFLSYRPHGLTPAFMPDFICAEVWINNGFKSLIIIFLKYFLLLIAKMS